MMIKFIVPCVVLLCSISALKIKFPAYLDHRQADPWYHRKCLTETTTSTIYEAERTIIPTETVTSTTTTTSATIVTSIEKVTVTLHPSDVTTTYTHTPTVVVTPSPVTVTETITDTITLSSTPMISIETMVTTLTTTLTDVLTTKATIYETHTAFNYETVTTTVLLDSEKLMRTAELIIPTKIIHEAPYSRSPEGQEYGLENLLE
ncbi:uncharacterized protein LOC129758603 [Uranotaenia lowii]|uniref:uncharacterized protein LOC129758603 n=1 Tax=Uranotaenia lowii TaxID=190385 RepID=UPI0024791E9C|nr:uncharacterized protein LOC129758603 [Uranotaenia lowii]